MTEPIIRKAIIYCRAASSTLHSGYNAITAQDARCREYARQRGYEVETVFHEVASGNMLPRPGLDAMLDFLTKRDPEAFAVIVNSPSVLAREVSHYVMARNAIRERGAELRSPSMDLGGSAEDDLIQNLRAAIAQFEGDLDAQAASPPGDGLIKRSLRALVRRF